VRATLTMRVVMSVLVLALCLATAVSAAPLRGSLGMSEAMEPLQAQQQGELVSFLQAHQRAFADHQTSQRHEAPPSQQAQQAAASTVPAGAQDASSDNVLSAIEHVEHPHSLVQTQSQMQSGVVAKAGDGEEFGPCKTCVFVLERIKKGSNMLLPAICSELYHKYPDAYALCHQVLNALSINGNNVRYWLFEGCFKYEIYQSKEWIKPCPSHVMCSVLKDLSAAPFCPALPMENPFAEGGGGDGGGGE